MDASHSHPARDLEEEERGAAAERAAIAAGGVINGESASGGGAPVAALLEATAPEQGKAVDVDSYRGVTGDHHHGRLQARAADKRGAYPGTFSSEEEATEAYDLGAIKFRGLDTDTKLEISRDHHHGRLQARAADKRDTYLGTFSSQEEATEAYDIGAIKFRGLNTVTKSEISRDEDTTPMTSQAKEDSVGVQPMYNMNGPPIQHELESISDPKSSHQ